MISERGTRYPQAKAIDKAVEYGQHLAAKEIMVTTDYRLLEGLNELKRPKTRMLKGEMT